MDDSIPMIENRKTTTRVEMMRLNPYHFAYDYRLFGRRGYRRLDNDLGFVVGIVSR